MAFDFGGGKGGGTKPRPTKSFMSQPSVPDPLADVEYTDNNEHNATAELDAVALGFRERAKREQQRFKGATDTEFWAALCFRDRASKDAFLAAVGAARLGDKYIDGHQFAKLVGVELPDSE